MENEAKTEIHLNQFSPSDIGKIQDIMIALDYHELGDETYEKKINASMPFVLRTSTQGLILRWVNYEDDEKKGYHLISCVEINSFGNVIRYDLKKKESKIKYGFLKAHSCKSQYKNKEFTEEKMSYQYYFEGLKSLMVEYHENEMKKLIGGKEASNLFVLYDGVLQEKITGLKSSEPEIYPRNDMKDFLMNVGQEQ